MVDGVLLCEGKGNKEWNYFYAHDAGRQITRQKSHKSRIAIEKRLLKKLEKKWCLFG